MLRAAPPAGPVAAKTGAAPTAISQHAAPISAPISARQIPIRRLPGVHGNSFARCDVEDYKDCRFFEVHDTASGHTARPQICRLTRLPARHASCTLPRRESCSTPITHKTRPAMSSLSMIPPRPSLSLAHNTNLGSFPALQQLDGPGLRSSRYERHR